MAFLQTTRDGAVITLTMNQPETRNVLTGNTAVDELVQACAEIGADRSVRAVVLTAADPVFSAGGNLKDMQRYYQQRPSADAIREEYRNGIQRIPRAMQALDVPLYMHPAVPHPAVVDAYYKDYLKEFPGLLTAAWGFTVETATQAIRLVLSGLFDAYPGLKIILGHLGEGLPFSLWRIDMALARPGNRAAPFRDCFREHSGSPPAATSPPRRCCAACSRWAPGRVCSRARCSSR